MVAVGIGFTDIVVRLIFHYHVVVSASVADGFGCLFPNDIFLAARRKFGRNKIGMNNNFYRRFGLLSVIFHRSFNNGFAFGNGNHGIAVKTNILRPARNLPFRRNVDFVAEPRHRGIYIIFAFFIIYIVNFGLFVGKHDR